MLNLKRSAQDPILPVRASKHRKTSALYGDSPTASQGEGLLSHWISSFVNLTKAASGIVMDALKEPQPQRFSSSSLRRPDAAEQQRPPSARPSSLPSRQQRRSRSPKTRTGRTSPHSRHASDHDSTALRSNVLPSGQPEVASSSEPSQSVPGLHRDASDHASSASAANGGSPPLKQRLLPETIGPSGEPFSTPVAGPSKSFDTAPSTNRRLSFRPPIPGAYMSPSIETPQKPIYVPQTPQTAPRAEALSNPYYRSMAPPPSPHLPSVPTPRPQPPERVSDSEPGPPSATASTSTLTATPGSREEVQAAIAKAEKRLASRVVKKVFSRKAARPHIYQAAHKARVLEIRKETQEEMVEDLYRAYQSKGYSSDLQTFQGFLSYQQLLESQNVMSPHRSHTDLRSRYQDDEQRRRSYGDDVSPDFLERAIQRAKETLNGPKPLPAFIPSFEQLRISRRAKDSEIDIRLRGPPLPQSLPPHEDDEVTLVLRKRGVIAKAARLQVTDSDLGRLRPGTWLNDEIINFYGQLILDRSEARPKGNALKNGARRDKSSILDVHYFNSFFFEKLSREGYEKARLAKWTKKFDIFSKDVILIPINHGNSHWTAAAINFRRRRIESFDSMGVRRQDVFDLLREYVKLEHLNKKSKPFDWTDWVDYSPRDTPQQENGYDCGVFTCQFLEAISRGMDSPFNFTQRNMAYLRRRMIWEIAHTQLRGGT